MEILQLLVHQYINARKSRKPMVRLRWSEEELHWQTRLQFGRVLENIAMKNKDDGNRLVYQLTFIYIYIIFHNTNKICTI